MCPTLTTSEVSAHVLPQMECTAWWLSEATALYRSVGRDMPKGFGLRLGDLRGLATCAARCILQCRGRRTLARVRSRVPVAVRPSRLRSRAALVSGPWSNLTSAIGALQKDRLVVSPRVLSSETQDTHGDGLESVIELAKRRTGRRDSLPSCLSRRPVSPGSGTFQTARINFVVCPGGVARRAFPFLRIDVACRCALVRVPRSVVPGPTTSDAMRAGARR